MLSGLQSRFLLFLSLAISAAICLPVHAQVNGAPASVTSLGFGGNFINGVRSSVTSLGPNSYSNNQFSNNQALFGNCCANYFLPANPNPPLFSGHRHHRKDRDRDRDRDKDRDHNFFASGAEPVYVPYAIPYDEQGDDDSPNIGSPDADSSDADSTNSDVDYPRGAGPLNPDSLEKRAPTRRPAVDADAVARPQRPVASQPSTVLVFKDGHRSEVRNYAVVGDTLFDFASDRTHKILLADLDLAATHEANDERGVDFEIPTAAAQ